MARFISPDSLLGEPGELLVHNLYAYCGQNPVNRADQKGCFWNEIATAVVTVAVVAAAVTITCVTLGTAAPLAVVATAAVIGTVVGAATNVASQRYVQNRRWDEIDWGEVAVSGGAGGVSGALSASGLGPVGQIVGNATISGTASALKEESPQEIFEDSIAGAFSGWIGGPGAVNQWAKNGSRYMFHPNEKLLQWSISGVFKSSTAGGLFDFAYDHIEELTPDF